MAANTGAVSLLVCILCQASSTTQPEFDSHLPSSLTVQQGDTAYLPCRIFSADNM